MRHAQSLVVLLLIVADVFCLFLAIRWIAALGIAEDASSSAEASRMADAWGAAFVFFTIVTVLFLAWMVRRSRSKPVAGFPVVYRSKP
jgi:hypothetical protein